MFGDPDMPEARQDLAWTMPELRCHDLRVEYLAEPLGVGTLRPRSGWLVDGPQAAFEIEVDGSGGSPVWRSGRVTAGADPLTGYAGEPLRSNQAYGWRVRAGSAARPGRPPGRPPAETGLLDAADWRAEWISPRQEPALIERWTLFDCSANGPAGPGTSRSSPAATNNAQVVPFLERWLANLRADQLPDGRVPIFSPYSPYDARSAAVATGLGSIVTAAGWGDAIALVPWTLYFRSGDRRVLEENLDAMLAWIGYQRRTAAAELPHALAHTELTAERRARQTLLYNTGDHFGDWLTPSTLEGLPLHEAIGIAPAFRDDRARPRRRCRLGAGARRHSVRPAGGRLAARRARGTDHRDGSARRHRDAGHGGRPGAAPARRDHPPGPHLLRPRSLAQIPSFSRRPDRNVRRDREKG
jgi:hypothetical protein